MPRTKLSLAKETLAELTSDEMSGVVGAGDSDSCSCTIANVCVNLPRFTVETAIDNNLAIKGTTPTMC